MAPLVRVEGVAAPLMRANIDTDIIIPSREMKGVSKTGLAEGLFAGWRYLNPAARQPDPAFVLNQPPYAQARFLMAGENFGCGSSREHAVWALAEFGLSGVLAPSFSPIFFNNAVRNGLAPIVVPREKLEALAAHVARGPAERPLVLDMRTLTLTCEGFETLEVVLPEEAARMLLEGLDEIDLTLALSGRILAFRQADKVRRPWMHLDP